MATMKDMWDYPNNSSNGYMADSANWSDDESFGMDQRIKELLDGDYKAWPNLDPDTDLSMTVDTLNEVIAKYVHYYDSYTDDSNLTFNMLHKYPVVEATTRAKNGQDVRDILERWGGHLPDSTDSGVLAVAIDTHAPFNNGDNVTLNGFTSVPSKFSGLMDDGDTYYVRKYTLPAGSNANIVEFYTDANLTTLAFDPFETADEVLEMPQTDLKEYDGNLAFHAFVKNADDQMMMYLNAGHMAANESSVITSTPDRSAFRMGDLQQSVDLGDNGISEKQFFETKALQSTGGYNNMISWVAEPQWPGYHITDTTEIFGEPVADHQHTLAEETNFTNLLTVTSSTPGAFTISDTTITDSSFISEVTTDSNYLYKITETGNPSFGTWYYFLARIKYTLNSGTVTDTYSVGTDYNEDILCQGILKHIGSNYSLTLTMGGIGPSTQLWDDNKYQPTREDELLTIGDPGNVTLTIKGIKPLFSDHLLYVEERMLFHNQGVDQTAAKVTKSGVVRYEIDTLTIKHPGAVQYSYKDTNNATQYEAQVIGSQYWLEGATSASSANQELGLVATATVDASGYLDSVSIGTTPGDRGQWSVAGTRLFALQPRADEYVAPTVYAEDVWDTDDEWDSDAFSTSKRWPTHMSPIQARIVTSQPSSTTRSQNGTKYVRSSGVIKQQLELTYAPMTYDDFREFEACVELARGQATPFYVQVVDLKTSGNDVLLQRTDSDKDGGLSDPYSFRLREAMAVGDKTALVEGFPSNQSNVFVRGEYIIAELGYGNGQLVQIGNDNVDSNVFGEAKIRVPYGARVANGVGTQWYKNPSHIIVTLSEDDFEYVVGTDSLYRFTARFDFDEFK